MKHVALVIPVYNEEGNIRLLAEALRSVFKDLPYTYNLILVNDGSRDNSLQVVRQMATEDASIQYISFSRNFGKDSALKAGLDICSADVAITLDADLQHPPELIVKMLESWEQGFHVVYAYREEKNRNASVMHQLYSFLFYEIMNHLSELKLEQGISDFRLLDKKVWF
jgi:polyisoprenyl-phosphate glycosyltransferase